MPRVGGKGQTWSWAVGMLGRRWAVVQEGRLTCRGEGGSLGGLGDGRGPELPKKWRARWGALQAKRENLKKAGGRKWALPGPWNMLST